MLSTCTMWKMQKTAVIALFLPHLLGAVLISTPKGGSTCVGSDKQLGWKYDNPAIIRDIFYKVKVPGGTFVTILYYDGAVATVANNYNVRWDNDAGSVTIVNPQLNNTGEYSIDVNYSGGLLTDSNATSVEVLDPPKTLSYIKKDTEFTCTLVSRGTPEVELYIEVDGEKQNTQTVTAEWYKKVECCISGTAVECMSGVGANFTCITAQDPCWWYKWVVLALFVCVVVEAIVSIVVYILAVCDKVASSSVMYVMIIILYVLTVWALVMILLLILCTDEPTWSKVLVILSVIATFVSVAVNVAPMICCPDGEAAKLLRKMYKRIKKQSEHMDEKERKNLAGVLVVIYWFPWACGFIMLLPLCFKRWHFAEVVQRFWCHNDEEDHPQGQGNVAHSDKGRERAADSSKQKTKHEEALIETSSKTDSQHHRGSGSLSKTDIELTEDNNSQGKVIMRPQPPAPLPGIGQSHRDVEEPHYKNSRGLSSNFDDQKGLPLVDVRKQSLPPISATAKGDDDSPEIKKKKKKKKKREGNDTGRSDDD